MKPILFISIIVFIALLTGSAAQEQTVCCEQTTNNLFCQQVSQSQCAPNARQAPTSCESTSFCKPGVCYSPVEGTCMENTPQITCNARNATWSATSPPQCNLGCCILGDQAAFVSLVRCKRLASFLGLQVNYNQKIQSEVACVLSVQNQDRGACVYESEFEASCRFTTRVECNAGLNSTGSGAFYKDKLCTAPELGTVCERTRKTTCVPGKEEVYFVDTCGNPANVYDAGKLEDTAYWTNVVKPENSCTPGSANANSKSCGNCNYLQGSICRLGEQGTKATYGDYICADLNCKSTSNGKPYKHGESWCVYKDEGETGKGKNTIGSRFYRHICLNGQEVVEQCADFRQEECIESGIEISSGLFAQAACRVNRWQDCTAQTEQLDCENNDRRDCLWRSDIQNAKSGSGACIPKNPPGLKFWEGEQAKEICAQGNTQCTVIFEKGVFGGEKCVENCECLDAGWEKQRIAYCAALGDCGPNVNWVGTKGYKEGFTITR